MLSLFLLPNRSGLSLSVIFKAIGYVLVLRSRLRYKDKQIRQVDVWHREIYRAFIIEVYINF